ncbi:RNA-guided endonuclease InsQ/TnpB family protein [Actinokineospora xionganensis]|uniref:RNA-guided endonuclease InsQ/TnpB family protein n=1 Tax=Actinokineospora xionganensis TaxID=2684470 RepID=UPI0035E40D46
MSRTRSILLASSGNSPAWNVRKRAAPNTGANRSKSRRKVAVQHGKVSRARRDYQHKQALQLVRDNQAVYVEDLNIAGLVRNRKLAQAIHDAGWAQFVGLIEEKAKRYGRTVAKVSRWLPSSKTCADCGHVISAMPLRIREWACPECMVTHDRDYNAARNILAAGRAERLNASGARVSPPSQEALGVEAGGPIRGTAALESPACESGSTSSGEYHVTGAQPRRATPRGAG